MAPGPESQCCPDRPYKGTVVVDCGSVWAGCKKDRADSFGGRHASCLTEGSKVGECLHSNSGFGSLLSFDTQFQTVAMVDFPLLVFSFRSDGL